jgi:hypothetical protein
MALILIRKLERVQHQVETSGARHFHRRVEAVIARTELDEAYRRWDELESLLAKLSGVPGYRGRPDSYSCSCLSKINIEKEKVLN